MNYTTKEQDLINQYLSTNEPTKCKAHYGLHYTEHKGLAKNTKDTYGESMSTAFTPKEVYNEDGSLEGIEYVSIGWQTAMSKAQMTLDRKIYTLQPNFKDRVNKFKKILKRKARLSAHKQTTKKGNRVQNSRAKRALPTPPSKRA